MTSNPVWQPERYLAFASERLRPALDLLAHIPLQEAAHIVDLGCGPGQVTAKLSARWPMARITGVDADAAMLEKARSRKLSVTWRQADAATWEADVPLDLIYSNAALHWLPDHATLLPRLMGQLRAGGVFAAQLPDCRHGRWRQILRELAADPRWTAWLADFVTPAASEDLTAYWQVLQPHSHHLDIWATEYLHHLHGPHPVADWTASAGARPYLDRLPAREADEFLASYRRELAQAYPPDADGRTPFSFRRLFVIAARDG